MASTESALRAAKSYLLGHRDAREQFENFGWHLLTNYVVRNVDCHTKNIALLYSGINDTVFTPVYDVITTQVYPRYADNPPGLSIDGRKTWAPVKTLERFFNTRLGIAPRQYGRMVEALCDSAVAVGKEIVEAQRNEPRWHDIAKNMLHAWNDGMGSLRSPKASVHLRALTPVIQATGFSDPEPASRERSVVGRSELRCAGAGYAAISTGCRRCRGSCSPAINC